MMRAEVIDRKVKRPVAPVPPYVGGKRLLAKRIIEKINETDHKIYAEPFVGMGGVFLRREVHAKVEVINVLSGDVANFFRILQRHYVYFVEMIRFQISSRREFQRLSKCDPATLTDLERAARFLYLQRTSFGGKVEGRVFGVSPDRPSRFDVTRLIPMLEDLHERLSGVTVENLPYGDFIRRYDRKKTLFYLDPPYYGSENYYGKEMFSREDFAKLADQLASLKGQFILSLNDTPEVREIFAAFRFDEVSTRYTLDRRSSKKAGELIIRSPRRTS